MNEPRKVKVEKAPDIYKGYDITKPRPVQKPKKPKQLGSRSNYTGTTKTTPTRNKVTTYDNPSTRKRGTV